MWQPNLILSPLLGTPENARITSHFRPQLGPRERRGEAAKSDFVPLFGDPRERRDYVALPPFFGPLKGRREAATSDFVPLFGDPPHVWTDQGTSATTQDEVQDEVDMLCCQQRSTITVCGECEEHYCAECVDTHTCGTNVAC